MFGKIAILEPDVTLTDWLLAAQCLCFAVLIWRKSADVPWSLLFACLSFSSLSGGVVHGFLPDETTAAYAILWRLTLISIGGVTLAAWYAGAALPKSARWAGWIRAAAVVQFVVYVGIILFYSQEFLVAALNYLSAALFLLAVFVVGYIRTTHTAFLWGALSLALTFAGSFVQIAKIPLHPAYFNHNALYHAIQFVALCLLFVSARNLRGISICNAKQ